MRKTLTKGNTGIRWRFTEKSDDDLALLSSTRRELQLKNERLSNASKGTGLKINITKTKVMRSMISGPILHMERRTCQ